MIRKLLNRFKAKNEHKERLATLHNLNFNQFLNDYKHYNGLFLLNNLIEATNTNSCDYEAILRLEKWIEINKEKGLLSEFYTDNLKENR